MTISRIILAERGHPFAAGGAEFGDDPGGQPVHSGVEFGVAPAPPAFQIHHRQLVGHGLCIGGDCIKMDHGLSF
jgi:hypothetical protein